MSIIPMPSVKSAPASGLSEGLKAALRRQPAARNLAVWYGLTSGSITWEQAYQKLADEDKLACLTVDTTGACDLSCAGMCYYHPGISIHSPQAAVADVQRAIREAGMKLGMQSLVIAGKEPFLNPRRLFELLEGAPPKSERRFSVGVITNGRHISRCWNQLAEVARAGHLDFLDVSLDSGFPEQHDSIRGKPGTYSMAVEGLNRLIRNLPTVRVGVCSALRHDNCDGILELIRLRSDLVRHFWIFPIQPPPYSPIPPLNSQYLVRFARALLELLDTQLSSRQIDVTLNLQGIYLSEAVESGLFDWKDLIEDEMGTICAPVRTGKSLVLFQCWVLPEQALRTGRILYNGDYLPHLRFLQTADPYARSVGNIANASIVDLYNKSKERGSLFDQICRARENHQCQTRPCWGHCFGGWSVADQNLLDGLPLSMQPRLCLKERLNPAPSAELRII
jgi:uncharacterized Fe-S cluster-containing radical SAM superfamily protein